MFKDVITKYYDSNILKIGTKLHVKELLSCEYVNGEKCNCVYDVDDNAEIIDMVESDNCDEIDTIQIQFENYRINDDDEWNWTYITVDDVLKGEWEVEIL